LDLLPFPTRRSSELFPDDIQTVTEGSRQVQVMEARQGTQAEAAQVLQQLELVPRVEVVGRFVKNQQPRLLHQRTGQQHPLLLTTGQVGKGKLRIGTHPDLFQRLGDQQSILAAVAIEQTLMRRTAHGDHVAHAEAELLRKLLQYHSDTPRTPARRLPP